MNIVDRTKDLIKVAFGERFGGILKLLFKKSGGEWISSVEIETYLMAHPKVC